WIHVTGNGGITTNPSAATATWVGTGSALSRIQNDSAGSMSITVAAGALNGIDLDAGIILSSGGSNATFVKAGPGTMRLTNPGNTANFFLGGGTLRVDDMAALGSGTVSTGGVGAV